MIYIQAFCNEPLKKGDPVSIVSNQLNEYGRPIVSKYNGDYFGISDQDVVDIDQTRYPYFGTTVGGLINIFRSGVVMLPIIPYAEVNKYIKPDIQYGYKVTKKRKKKSIGRIISVNAKYMEVYLL